MVQAQFPAYTTLTIREDSSYSATYTNVSNGVVLFGISGEAVSIFYTASINDLPYLSGTFNPIDGSYNYSIVFQDAADARQPTPIPDLRYRSPCLFLLTEMASFRFQVWGAEAIRLILPVKNISFC